MALHVGSHKGAVCVVVFKKWNQRSCHGNNLFRRNIHEVDFVSWYVTNFGSSCEIGIAFHLKLEVGEACALGTFSHENSRVPKSLIRI